ncbi:O-antigen ligase [Synechococcus sp. PCC 7336]|uniref:O-antigen ligase family protein n=1 Tax=Synechococcus sp. PCC 7336 TaxID=195250 RepID=UPI0003622EDE|nr:O-antigen ligase [Synechococcus sp. PCC 7336]
MTQARSFQSAPSGFARYLAWFEELYCIFCLLFFAGAFTLTVRQTLGVPVTSGDPLTTLLNVVTLVATMALVALRYRRVIQMAKRGLLLWLFVGFCCLSVLWSRDPDFTIDQSITLLRVTLFGLYFAARYTLAEQLRLLARTACIVVVGSLLYGVALPSYGVTGRGGELTDQALRHLGAWRGLFVHKNVLGRVLGLCTVVLFLQARQGGRRAWMFWLVWGLTGILAVGSQSKTAIAMYVSLSTLLALASTLRWKFVLSVPVWLTAIAISFCLVALLLYNFETILELAGRDATLSGRTKLWTAAMTQLFHRPLLGYGYSAFWRADSQPMLALWFEAGFDPRNGHNGFLDLALELGSIGLLSFFLTFAVTAGRSLLWALRSRDAVGLYPLGLLAYMVAANLSESPLLQHNLMWTLYVASSLTVCTRSQWRSAPGREPQTGSPLPLPNPEVKSQPTALT